MRTVGKPGWGTLLVAGIALACAGSPAATPPQFQEVPLAPSRKPSQAELRQRLSPIQYRVTQEGDTEPPFRNEFWNNHAKGIYVDVVTGKALFASTDKFESGTGWPSFTRPLPGSGVIEKKDFSFGMARTEVRSSDSGSHLGHLFDDGPRDKGGLRYCINSAALRFIPAEDLEKAGYGQYRGLF